MSIYLDPRGRRWILVANTRSGIYAWFRPVEHADDGYYDRSFKLASMVRA